MESATPLVDEVATRVMGAKPVKGERDATAERERLVVAEWILNENEL